jgi:hypothetical protein
MVKPLVIWRVEAIRDHCQAKEVHYVQMTSVVRGRGWASKQDKGLPLRRPGDMTTADMDVDTLIAAVHSINLKGTNESVAMLRRVEELLKTLCQAEEDLR